MSRHTPLHSAHLKASARMVDFAGWEMPLHYGSQIQEHHAVRKAAGVFDVSHMGIIDFTGPSALGFLQRLLSADVGQLPAGKGLYCCLLNEEGGVKDDLIAYCLDKNHFRLVVNAGTREKDLAWFRQHAEDAVHIHERTDLCMLALQGPLVKDRISAIFPEDRQDAIPFLPSFGFVKNEEWMVARTGYTGEDGFEILLPKTAVLPFWNGILEAGIQPCGLGSRDTLRLEAGLNLYGADMDENTSPLESGLGWTVPLDGQRDFIGKSALLRQREKGIGQKRVGLVTEQRAVLRNHLRVETASGQGLITSGSFSPTLNLGIALARIPVAARDTCEVHLRGKKIPARIIRPPFVRHGKPCFDGVSA